MSIDDYSAASRPKAAAAVLLTPATQSRPYTMSISRLTVEKLGVKLYDTASAVVAELIANGYDADAEVVRVRVPLSTVLASRGGGGAIGDGGYVIEVVDDGHGMTPDEAIEHYLKVGRDRRKHTAQGKRSRGKGRPVMGRKGIGKLAPFGICKHIEVLSAGGQETPDGFLVTHFTMDFDRIMSDTDMPVTFDPGPLDRTFSHEHGTTIRLSTFAPKRVPDSTTFLRQLARRFTFARTDFAIVVEDTRDSATNPPTTVAPLSIPIVEQTKIDLSERPVRTEDGQDLPVSGWLALAKQAYKNEEMAGVRIYARGKIVGSTRDFEQPTGFTGEFMMRSYLVGEVIADWLDLDEGEDLVRTDRQAILWDSDFGRALRAWGAGLIKEIGANSRKPRRKLTSDIFMEKSGLEARARDRYGDPEVVAAALALGKQIGGFADGDELQDQDYIEGLCDVILTVAPHTALIQAFQEFNAAASGTPVLLESVIDLFSKTRVAEVASYAQIADERVQAVRRLESIVRSTSDESQLQELLAEAPWLIEPSWSVITRNQSLKTFASAFEGFWQKRHGTAIALAIDHEKKRPDFTLIHVGQMLHVVEIKASGHAFDDADFERLVKYVDAFDAFFKANSAFAVEFPRGYRIDLIADSEDLRKPANSYAYGPMIKAETIVRKSWQDFLLRARQAHEQFLEIHEQARRRGQAMQRQAARPAMSPPGGG